jgi:hypothetical protein
MPIDNPTAIELQQIRNDFDHNIANVMQEAGVAAAFSLIPGVGSAIKSLLDGKAQRNIQQRWVKLFEDMGRRIEEINESIPNTDYYASEEFQTLLALAWEQLLTTHDEKKRKMLAAALANSGSEEFVLDDHKEQHLRTLRDLTPHDLQILKWLDPTRREISSEIRRFLGTFPSKITNPKGEELCSLTRLVGLGLVTETLEKKVPASGRTGSETLDAQNALHALLTDPPDRSYDISGYGIRFLRFLSQTPEQDQNQELYPDDE